MAAHILGLLAVATFLWCFQLRSRKNIILVNLISRMLYILQYVLLGAFEGATLDFMGFITSFFTQHKDKPFITKYFKIIVVGVNVLLILVGLALYENIYSIFAILGIVFEVTALWLTKEKHIRLLSLAAAPMWLIYNLMNEAYFSIIGNVFVMISIGIALFRFDFKKAEK